MTRLQAALGDGEPRDLLDALLMGQLESERSEKSHSSGITDDHVLMTAAEAFGAGVETTSTTLLWILAYLLHHPEVRWTANVGTPGAKTETVKVWSACSVHRTGS